MIGVAVTQWIGKGEIRKDGVKIMYSGRAEDIHRGVAVLLKGRAKLSYIEHKPILSRIITANEREAWQRERYQSMHLIQLPERMKLISSMKNYRNKLQPQNKKKLLYVTGDLNSWTETQWDGYGDIMNHLENAERYENGGKKY